MGRAVAASAQQRAVPHLQFLPVPHLQQQEVLVVVAVEAAVFEDGANVVLVRDFGVGGDGGGRGC